MEESPTLPQAGFTALDMEIRQGSLTQYDGVYDISSVQQANMDLVLDRYNQYFCVTITPPIPREEYSPITYRHYTVIQEGSTWKAYTEDNSAYREWERISCTNWDD